MPLFERSYKASATAEFERKTRELEEKDKKAQTKEEFEDATRALYSNLNFAERINLVSVEQAETYRDRVKLAAIDFERMQREEFDVRTDDFENPRERTKRYMKMEDAQSRIAQERAAQNAEKAVAKQVKQAKKDGLIDQFIYGSISASYLADIVDSL